MQNQAAQQVIKVLQDANNVMVTVKNGPTVDDLTAAIALTLILNRMNKHAITVFSGRVPSNINFLQPEAAIDTTTDSLRDFIISLDKSKADKLRYKVEDEVVRIFITPYKSSISEKDLEFSQGDFNVDAVIALGVVGREDIDQAIMAHGRILHDATVVTVTNQIASQLGGINWHNEQASSVSEMVASIADTLGPDLLDGQIATALMTGIVAETDRFKNQRTTPQVLSISSRLMSAGANQQLIVEKLEETDQPLPLRGENVEQAANDDGALSIAHQDGEQPVSNLHIDDHGNITAGQQPMNDLAQPSTQGSDTSPPSGLQDDQPMPGVFDPEQTFASPRVDNAVAKGLQGFDDEVDNSYNPEYDDSGSQPQMGQPQRVGADSMMDSHQRKVIQPINDLHTDIAPSNGGGQVVDPSNVTSVAPQSINDVQPDQLMNQQYVPESHTEPQAETDSHVAMPKYEEPHDEDSKNELPPPPAAPPSQTAPTPDTTGPSQVSEFNPFDGQEESPAQEPSSVSAATAMINDSGTIADLEKRLNSHHATAVAADTPSPSSTQMPIEPVSPAPAPAVEPVSPLQQPTTTIEEPKAVSHEQPEQIIEPTETKQESTVVDPNAPPSVPPPIMPQPTNQPQFFEADGKRSNPFSTS